MYLVKAELAVIAFLILVMALAVKVGYGLLFSLPFWVMFVLWLIAFRNPKRAVPSSPLAVVSPIDATVAGVFYANDSFQEKSRIIIRLSRHYTGIMGLFSPTEGQVMQTWYGEQYKRAVPGSSTDQGHVYTAWIQTDEKDDVLISFFRAKTKRYLQVKPQPGERVGQGKTIGLSSAQYVDVLLPENAKVKVQKGDKLKAGESIIGMLVHLPKRAK